MRFKATIRICSSLAVFGCASLVTGLTFAEDRIDFKSEVIPVLTKLGCNAGSCHGSAAGRGGFKLSLYGSQPVEDYRAIVRDAKGRRINRNDHAKSLLLLKPGGEMDHGGDQRFDPDDSAGQILSTWIRQGADLNHLTQLTAFDVGQPTIELEEAGGEHAFRFMAKFSDQVARDVTRWTVLTSNDESSVSIDSDTNRAKVLRPGRHIVLARFMDQVAPIEILVPYYKTDHAIGVAQDNNFVDELVYEKLGQLNIPVGGQTNDAAFLRRVSIDLTGRLPSAERIELFLSDESPNKRSRLIRELLSGEAFTDYWTYQIATQLRIRSQAADKTGARVYHFWLRDQIAARKSWKEIASALLLSEGDSHKFGAANFYRTTGNARLQSEFVTESLMGVKLRCANCHNHPLDHWTQDDYHGLAAIFSQVKQARVVSLNRSGENIHARTGKPAVPRIPGEYFIESNEPDIRVPFAQWMLQDSNPYFAQAMVNRIWKSLMGRGLVEPVDDLRNTNPATHPALLKRLAEDFADHGFDLRHTIELICNSRAYQRETGSPKNPEFHRTYYGNAMLRPLPAEVLADAICEVTGIVEHYAGLPSGTRAIQLHDSKIPSQSLDILGRCSRDESCESESNVAGGLASRLHLLNGPLLNQKIADPESHLQSMIRDNLSTKQIVSFFYDRAFARNPNTEELDYWVNKVDNHREKNDGTIRNQRLEDFVWSILNSKEFTTNH